MFANGRSCTNNPGVYFKGFFCSAEKCALQVGLWYSLGPTKPVQSSSLQMLICFWVLASPCTTHPARSKPPGLEGSWVPCPTAMKPEGILIMCCQKYHVGCLGKRGKESRKDYGCAVVVSWSLIIEKCSMFKVVFALHGGRRQGRMPAPTGAVFP